MDARTKILETIDKMLAADDKISIFSVAEKCGISHSLIYNRYPDIKERIKQLKTIQKEKRKVTDDNKLIANLITKNKLLHDKLKNEDRSQNKTELKVLLTHIQEIYSMYDSLLDERNRMAAKIANMK